MVGRKKIVNVLHGFCYRKCASNPKCLAGLVQWHHQLLKPLVTQTGKVSFFLLFCCNKFCPDWAKHAIQEKGEVKDKNLLHKMVVMISIIFAITKTTTRSLFSVLIMLI